MSHREWVKRIAEQRSSGLSALAYCRERQIKASVFYYRRRRLSKGLLPVVVQAKAPRFTRVEVVKSHSPFDGPVELSFPRGVMLRAQGYPHARWLAEVVDALGCGGGQ